MQVRVNRISKRFGEVPVLRDISFDIDGGKVTALTGPSGSGKSTLLGIIGGATRPDSGSVTMCLDGQSTHVGEDSVAWVPQGANSLPSRTARDNAAIGALSNGMSWAEAYSAADDALNRVGLYRLRVKRAGLMSGGELQRLSFARAMCSGRQLILADEPTANLDEASTLNICSILAEISEESTVIVATHDPLVVDAASSIIDVRALTRHG